MYVDRWLFNGKVVLQKLKRMKKIYRENVELRGGGVGIRFICVN